LSRNWGHMGAISAGLQTARGDAVVLMDGDFQDPPQVIPELVESWRNGAQVVVAVRRSRQEKRKLLAKLFPLFYKVLGALSDFPIPLNAGIFGLMDRQTVDSVNTMRERNRYLPGLRAWVGYTNTVVYYDRQDRLAGEGKLSFISRIKYAMDATAAPVFRSLRAFLRDGGTPGFREHALEESVERSRLWRHSRCIPRRRRVAVVFGCARGISRACVRRSPATAAVDHQQGLLCFGHGFHPGSPGGVGRRSAY